MTLHLARYIWRHAEASENRGVAAAIAGRGGATAQAHQKIPVYFYQTENGNEPARDWLKKKLGPVERKLVGQDIMTVEYGWPIGMPTCRPLGDGLHEVRTDLPDGIARVFFYVDKRNRMVLLHGILKKTQTTPEADLKLARGRQRKHKRGLE